jgi:uncharacterized protein YecA (UPF0149 family)
MAIQQADIETRVLLRKLQGRGNFLPKAPLRDLARMTGEVIPLMREQLALLAQNPEASRRDSGNLSLYALYFLAACRDTQSATTLRSICSMDGEWLEAWLGECMEVDMARILASIMAEEQALLRAIVEDKEVWDIMRATALEALLILCAEGKLTRVNLREYGLKLLEQRHRDDRGVMAAVVTVLKELYPDQEVMDVVHAAFREDTVETMVIQESELWALTEAFSQEEQLARLKESYSSQLGDPIVRLASLERFHSAQRLGRNDSCPCGSGKKFKDCCA